MTGATVNDRVRSKVLTNSAAEYVEQRADHVLGAAYPTSDATEFVPVLDKFRLQEDVPRS